MRLLNRYSTDKANRLLIRRGKRRLVTDGRFALRSNNRLSYYVDEPASWRRIHDVPPRIHFEGNWEIDAGHNLVLKLKENKEQSGTDVLTLRGTIIAAEGNSIAFEIKTFDCQGNTHMQILQFAGAWQADEYNRLSFVLQREQSPDILKFEGNWQINQDQQITYSYEKTQLREKEKITHTLIFDGFWQMNEQNRLRYILTRGINSFFDFRIQAETPNLYPANKRIKFRLGIGIKGKKPAYEKTMVLYGAWKFGRRAGLSFEMDYGGGRVERMEFGMNIILNKRDTVTFSLLSTRKEPLGLCLTATRRFLKDQDAEAFVRLKQTAGQPGVEVGVKIPF